jgi:hypothetical protein
MTTTLALDDLVALARWLAGHSVQLPQLLDLIRTWRAAQSFGDCWTAIKAIGDLIVPWLEDCPLLKVSSAAGSSVPTISAGDRAALEGELKTLGLDWGSILDELPQLLQLLQMILPLLTHTA